MEAIGIMVLAAALVVGAYFFIVRQSKAKGRWGFGSLHTVCPRCGADMPVIRKAASRQEVLWGGWTCAKCGCKVDKYGQERAA
jgi:transposase-like protein